MNKHQIKELKHIIIDWFKYWKWDHDFFNEKYILKDLISHIFKDTNIWKKEYSELDTEIFWKVNKKQKQLLFDYIDWKDLDKKTKKEVNLFWKKIIDLLSSVYSEVPSQESINLETKIRQEMKDWWQALERFLIYSISKNWSDINLKIKKSKNEYEWNKIDFISHYNIYWENTKINFANQVTAWFVLEKKKNDLNNLAYSLDNPEEQVNNKKIAKLDNKSYRKENIPDLPILFYVRNWLQNITRDHTQLNYFNKAYKEIWHKDILTNVWKTENWKRKNKESLLYIWESYPILISHFLDIIKEIDLNNDYSEENIKKAKWNLNIDYNSKTNIFSMIFSKNNSYKNIEYWLDFYITNKFLKKIWINSSIERKKEFYKYKKNTKN